MPTQDFLGIIDVGKQIIDHNVHHNKQMRQSAN